MAAKKEQDNTVEGYSGSPHEGKGDPSKDVIKGASKEATKNHTGATEPTQVFTGDGKTKADN